MIRLKDERLEECLAYFRGKEVYKKLFEKFREKYISLGHLGGSVTLTGLNALDKGELEGFVQRNYTGNKTVTISASLLSRALAESRFAGLTWEAVWEAYFGEPLMGKRERALRLEEEKRAYFERVLSLGEKVVGGGEVSGGAKVSEREEVSGGGEVSGRKEVVGGRDVGIRWLKGVLESKGDGYQTLMQHYRGNRVQLEKTLLQVLRAVDALPVLHGRKERVAVFAAKVTGDPHYFDEGTLGERLLCAYLRNEYGAGETSLSGPERKSALLFHAGILKDDLSNYTLAYGIHARTGAGELHPGIEGFLEREEPVQLSLLTLGGLEGAWAGGMVYVVENPSICAALAEYKRDIAVVCTNGQIRLSTLVLLDLLSRQNRFLYAGDFDPEGLLIAQTLKRRYGEKLYFWNYKGEYYNRAVSRVALSEQRLKKLERVQEEGLFEIKQLLLERKYAAYQERLLETAYLPEL